jgi:Na+/melibiose symporter-like transporter
VDEAQRWRSIGLVTFVVAGFLLVSMGGAIVAAPVTVPLMLLAASRCPTRGFRATALVLSALTVVEVLWAVTYLTVEERQPWIWLMPALGLLATVVVSRHRRRLPPARARRHAAFD